MTSQERGPIVYVVQEPRYRAPDGEWRSVNMLPALDFGSLELLLESDRQMSVLNAAQLTRVLKAKLANYRDQDFILAGGDPAAIGVACAVAAVVNGGRFTVLKWDRQERRYYPVPVNLKEST